MAVAPAFLTALQPFDDLVVNALDLGGEVLVKKRRSTVAGDDIAVGCVADRCLLSGVIQTSHFEGVRTVFDPQRKWTALTAFAIIQPPRSGRPVDSVNAHAGRREIDNLFVVAQEVAFLIGSEVLHGLGICSVQGVVTSIERLEHASGLRSTIAQVRVYVVIALCVRGVQSECHFVPFQGTPTRLGSGHAVGPEASTKHSLRVMFLATACLQYPRSRSKSLCKQSAGISLARRWPNPPELTAAPAFRLTSEFRCDIVPVRYVCRT
jgi:hypothetical protein